MTIDRPREERVEVTLLPCPFCGGKAEVFGPYGWYSRYGITHNCPTFYNGGSEAFKEYPSASYAADAWNTRAALSRQEASGEVREALEPYRSADFSGSPEAAAVVGWDWISGLADREREADAVALEIHASPIAGDGRVISLYRGTKLIACATIFRDPMNFSVLVRWQAALSAQPLADAGDVERITLFNMREIAKGMGYESILEALEDLDRLRALPSTAPDELRAEGDVERVARAICKRRGCHWFGSDALKGDNDPWLADARAAIAALARPDRMAEMEGLRAVWQQARQNHADHSATGDREQDIRFFALGLSGEAGELANFVKKRWRDGDGHDQAIKYEVADVCAYAFMLADTMGMSPDDLIATIAEKQRAFLAKMASRAALSGSEGGRNG